MAYVGVNPEKEDSEAAALAALAAASDTGRARHEAPVRRRVGIGAGTTIGLGDGPTAEEVEARKREEAWLAAQQRQEAMGGWGVGANENMMGAGSGGPASPSSTEVEAEMRRQEANRRAAHTPLSGDPGHTIRADAFDSPLNSDQWRQVGWYGVADATDREDIPLEQVTFDQSQANAARSQQQSFADMLAQQAAGNGPSVAQNQLRMGQEAAAKQAMALAASNPGVSPGMALRMAQNQASDQALAVNQQAAALRAQEQLGAQAQLGQTLQGMRGQDIAQEQAAAGHGAQQAAGQFQAAMQNEAVQNQLIQYYTELGYDVDAAAAQAQMALEQARLQQYLGEQGISVQQGQLDLMRRGQNMGIVGGAIGALGALGAGALQWSDRRTKQDIKPATKEALEMLDKLEPSSWKYKDKKHGEGEWSGVMAQDLARSKMGRSMLIEKDGYMAIDSKKALSAALSALAAMRQREKMMEKKIFKLGGK